MDNDIIDSPLVAGGQGKLQIGSRKVRSVQPPWNNTCCELVFLCAKHSPSVVQMSSRLPTGLPRMQQVECVVALRSLAGIQGSWSNCSEPSKKKHVAGPSAHMGWADNDSTSKNIPRSPNRGAGRIVKAR